MIRAILACDAHGGVGKNGVLPWPTNIKDLMHFKKLTNGQTVVMGSATWNSKDMPSPLPGRKNIVVSRNPSFKADGAQVLSKNVIQDLTTLAEDNKVYVIGGANLFGELIDHISILHLTRIAGNYDCDTFINLDALDKIFVKIDSVDVDNKTIFETYIARNLLYDFYLSTAI